MNAHRPMVMIPVAPRAQAHDPQPWLMTPILLGLLLVAAVIAWRRARGAGNRGPRAFVRILWAAAAFTVAIMLMATPFMVRRLDHYQALTQLLAAAMSVGLLMTGASLTIAALDAAARPLRPARNRDWLVIALAAYPLLLAAVAAIAISALSLPFQFLPRQLLLLPVCWTVGLTWWAWLPAPEGDATAVTGVFE